MSSNYQTVSQVLALYAGGQLTTTMLIGLAEPLSDYITSVLQDIAIDASMVLYSKRQKTLPAIGGFPELVQEQIRVGCSCGSFFPANIEQAGRKAFEFALTIPNNDILRLHNDQSQVKSPDVDIAAVA